MVEKGDSVGLELGPPDISIRNVEARTYFVVVLFLGGGGREGVGGWVLVSIRHMRPPRHDPGLPGAPTFVRRIENANESFFICK